MKSKHAMRHIALAMLGIVSASEAFAQASSSYYYIGGGIGQARAELNDERITRPLFGSGLTATNINRDNHDTAYKLFGGYQFNRNFALEAGYFNLGKFGFSANTTPLGTFNGQVKIQGFNLDLVGTLPVSERFSVFARAGAQAAKTGATYGGSQPTSIFNPSPSRREVNYKAGLGLQYEVTPSFLVRAEVERYRITDNIGKKANADMVSVSLVFPFGRSYAPVPRAMTPEPIYVAPAPMPVPAPAPMPAPQPAPVVVVTPPPAPAPAPMPAPVERRRVSFTAESLFAFDKSDIKPDGKAALDRFSNELRGTQFDSIRVEGHTDRLGSDSYNQRLSTKRAEAVKGYLISSGGVNSSKISAVGKGETMPVTKPGDCRGNKPTKALIACLQPDRRVDVEVSATK
ncbi:MAG: OmpA family protein [Rhizobacter sp.]|nr:OmpA family protein [Burkholderiales bacterium]